MSKREKRQAEFEKRVKSFFRIKEMNWKLEGRIRFFIAGDKVIFLACKREVKE